MQWIPLHEALHRLFIYPMLVFRQFCLLHLLFNKIISTAIWIQLRCYFEDANRIKHPAVKVWLKKRRLIIFVLGICIGYLFISVICHTHWWLWIEEYTFSNVSRWKTIFFFIFTFNFCFFSNICDCRSNLALCCSHIYKNISLIPFFFKTKTFFILWKKLCSTDYDIWEPKLRYEVVELCLGSWLSAESVCVFRGCNSRP